MSVWKDMYHGDTHFDFVGNRKRWFTISAIIIVISLGSLLFRGLNLGIDFEGGTLVEVENPAGASVSDVRSAISGLGLADAKVQLTGGGSGVRVQAAQLPLEQEDRLVDVLAAVAGVDPTDANRQSVGPTFGDQVTDSAIRALVVFLIVIALFITWRLEWRMAAAGLVALAHDLVFTSGIYSLVGFEVTPATVVAILTILGYSLYDTVVVFDKVQENINERGERHTISAIVNRSMNQVFMRSLNTSLTSLLPIGSLLFVGSFLLGAATLREFALALFIGIGTGTYSSIFLAAPLVAIWKEKEDRWQRVRRRLERKGVEDEFAVKGIITDMEAHEELTAAPTETGAVPRPPRKRKRRR